jgi:hypothetical protein
VQFVHPFFWVEKNRIKRADEFLPILCSNRELLGVVVDFDDGGDVNEIVNLETDGSPNVLVVLFHHVGDFMGFLLSFSPTK